MPYISHQVIAKFKKYTEYGKDRKVRNCTLLQAFELENGIAFSLSVWCGGYNPLVSYKLSHKNGKFNFYRTSIKGNKGVKIGDPVALFNRLEYRVGKQKKQGLAKAQAKRVYELIKKFCKSKNVNIKYLSKDPVVLIKQLCYPALTYLNKDILSVSTGQCGRFAKANLTKAVLGTNGSLSKKLLTESIQKYPGHYQEIVLTARVIKLLFGLDKTQEFLKEVDLLHIKPLKQGYRESLNLTKTIKKYKEFFGKFSFNKVKKLFSLRITDSSIWPDTVDFSSREGVILPDEFDHILDLHDKLAVQINRRQKAELILQKSKPIEIPQVFKECLNNWKSDEFELVCPTTGMELVEWSELMKNCVSTYESSIRNGSYYIVGLKQEGQLKYNIGFSINHHKLNMIGKNSEQLLQGQIEFSQWSGKGNSRIPLEDQISIWQAFQSSSNDIAHCIHKGMVKNPPF